ncbi:MAG: tRNA (adenosine(37)-N6)-threonylcarbamoyltransferase complex dimerization subunit type 1 TsaB [Huintestinicola sp.]
MLILGIDTSGKTASCALCSEDEVIAQYTFVTKLTHSQVILPLVKRMLSDSGHELSDVDFFAAASGPGSYTGLRIGISAVKAMAFSLGKGCCGVSELESLAYNFAGTDSLVCSVMHARQKLVYASVFRTYADGRVERLTEDEIISTEKLCEKLDGFEGRIIAAGDYARELCSEYGRDNIFPAQPQLRAPLASSLCFAAMGREPVSPDELNADYMQVTKAEKDLQESGKKGS